MKIKKLIAGLQITLYRGNQEVEITGLCAHSKRVAPGYLFIAKKKYLEGGDQHIEEAISAGAIAILTDIPNPFLKGVIQLIHPDVAELEAILAVRYYHDPSYDLYTIGITGTNGKTTTSFLIKHLFDHLNLPCGLIGTIEYIIGRQHFKAEATTPDAITTQKLMREMVKQECRACIMEVSSHGLAQKRCEGIHFDLAIFTNLSQDHLDYHHTMDKYAQEKAKLFEKLSPTQTAIVNGESPWSEIMIKNCKAKVLRYGFTRECDLYADQIQLDRKQTQFSATYQGQQAFFRSHLIGRYNVLNCLCAIAACLVKGFTLEEISHLIETFKPVPGRLEKVENEKGLNIFVDYAHTPDALQKVLECLCEIKERKIITVFGCGGDRDRGKRAKMGRVAEEKSDFTFITSDNPRTEIPLSICDEIATGFSRSNFAIVVDRREAIERAIEMAEGKDLILIAGKGHETYQHFSNQIISFDDRKVAQEIANKGQIVCNVQ